jgi:hypothetical protein
VCSIAMSIAPCSHERRRKSLTRGSLGANTFRLAQSPRAEPPLPIAGSSPLSVG